MSTFMSENLMSVDIWMLGGIQSLGMPALVIFSSSPAPFAYLSLLAIIFKKY